jgi:hypothetical protein
MKIIETQLSLDQFFKANLAIYYRRRGNQVGLIIGILLLIFIFLILPFHTIISSPLYIIFLVVFFGISPLMLYIQSKRVYTTSRIKEKINYEFQEKEIIVRGESFSSQFTWNKIHKVTVTKNWVFIWQNSLQALPIPKKDIWEGEILKMREILDANNVKHNFK